MLNAYLDIGHFLLDIGHSLHAMKPQQMPGLLLIINAKDQRVALVGEKNFDWIVGVATVGEHLKLRQAGLFKKLKICCGFRQRDIGVSFFFQKLFQHFIGKCQSGTGKSSPVFPAIAGTTEIVASSLRELHPHRRMRLRGWSRFRSGGSTFLLPFFHKTKFVVVQQAGSKFGQK